MRVRVDDAQPVKGASACGVRRDGRSHRVPAILRPRTEPRVRERTWPRARPIIPRQARSSKLTPNNPPHHDPATILHVRMATGQFHRRRGIRSAHDEEAGGLPERAGIWQAVGACGLRIQFVR